jgi:hypothetical protein
MFLINNKEMYIKHNKEGICGLDIHNWLEYLRTHHISQYKSVEEVKEYVKNRDLTKSDSSSHL